MPKTAIMYPPIKGGSVTAEAGSRLFCKLKDSGFVEVPDGKVSKWEMRKVVCLIEVYPQWLIYRTNVMGNEIVADFTLNVGSMEAIANLIGNLGKDMPIKGGLVAKVLDAEDAMSYIEPIFGAKIQQSLVEIPRPWGPEAARHLFSLIRDDPSLNNRALLIDNIVIRDKNFLP